MLFQSFFCYFANKSQKVLPIRGVRRFEKKYRLILTMLFICENDQDGHNLRAIFRFKYPSSMSEKHSIFVKMT